jgi:hypothetical protein
LLEHVVPRGPAHLDELPGGFAHSAASLIVGKQRLDRRRPGGRIGTFDSHTIYALCFDERRRASSIAHDHGQPRRLGLEHHVGQDFGGRRKHEQVRSGIHLA